MSTGSSYRPAYPTGATAVRAGRLVRLLSAAVLAVTACGNDTLAAPAAAWERLAAQVPVIGAWMIPAKPLGSRRVEHVPVLMYHRISCPERGALYPGLWVCPGTFDRTMRTLKHAGWDTITSRDLAESLATGRSVPHHRFVIVIDDGNRDGYDAAYPILERYDFEAVFAVVVGRVDRRKSAMTWAELRELESEGHEIADHSMTHPDLRRVNAAGRLLQIQQSADRLEQHLGHRPRTFVYPFGFWDKDVVAQVRASGFWIAYTTAYGAAQRYGARFLSPRIRVDRGDAPNAVLAKVQH